MSWRYSSCDGFCLGSSSELFPAVGLKPWSCCSVVDKQAALAVKKTLATHASNRQGASLKSLVLAPHVKAKKATFKVALNTLRYLTAIKKLLADTEILQVNRYTHSASYLHFQGKILIALH